MARWHVIPPDNIDGQGLDYYYGLVMKEYEDEKEEIRKQDEASRRKS